MKQALLDQDTPGVAGRATPFTSAWWKSFFLLVIGLSIVTLAIDVAMFFTGPTPFSGVWEDACMFARYAHNFWAGGGIAWDPGGPATYGLTSPFYFLSVVVPISRFCRNPLLLAAFSSMLSGALFAIAITVLIAVLLRGRALIAFAATALVFASFADASLGFTNHFVGGMDTFFGLLYLTLYLLLALWMERSGSIVAAVFTGLYGGLAYGSRPDLVLFTVIVPIASFLLHNESRRKRLAVTALMLTSVVVFAEMLTARAYFNSPFPLAFYAKALRLYPGLKSNRVINYYQLFDFLRAYRILFLVIAADVFANPRRWWRNASVLERGVLAAAVVYLSYITLAVLQMMPAFQRFFYPSLPAIVFLAACSFARLVDRIPLTKIRFPRNLRWVAVAGAILWIAPDLEQVRRSFSILGGHVASTDITAEYRANWSNYWAALDEVSSLPRDLVIATTETGHVGAMNTGKVVVDLAGLNNVLFARSPFSAALLFQRYRPDLIYMPPEPFVGMNRELTSNPKFQADYDWIPAEKLNAAMGVALLRGSKYYPEMQAIFARRMNGA